MIQWMENLGIYFLLRAKKGTKQPPNIYFSHCFTVAIHTFTPRHFENETGENSPLRTAKNNALAANARKSEEQEEEKKKDGEEGDKIKEISEEKVSGNVQA